jgi:hypothetical protein
VRKKSKYRPKGVILDPMAYIQQGFTPIAEHGSALVTMRLRSHSALEALVTGKANRANIDVLIAMVNMTEALYRMGVGREYSSEVRAGLEALRSVGRRSMELGRFVLKSDEMAALNTVMELHDAQLDHMNEPHEEQQMLFMKKFTEFIVYELQWLGLTGEQIMATLGIVAMTLWLWIVLIVFKPS